MIDVAILAGGKGTRLQGLWDEPKCLAPVAGKPLLYWLLRKIIALKPNRIAFALGHKSVQVQEWMWTVQSELLKSQEHRIVAVEPQPLGTAGALRCLLPALTAPVLVLNGDTLPRYDLRALFGTKVVGSYNSTETFAAFKGVRYAGALILGVLGFESVRCSQDFDLDSFIHNSRLVQVRQEFDFLDIGTPEGFERGKNMLPTSIQLTEEMQF